MKDDSPKQALQVGMMMWDGGFTMGTIERLTSTLARFKLILLQMHEGQPRPLLIELLVKRQKDSTGDRSTEQEVSRALFKTKDEALAAQESREKQLAAESRAQAIQELGANKVAEMKAAGTKQKHSAADLQDLEEARKKVLCEQYPDTCKAMDKQKPWAGATPEERAAGDEEVYRAYRLDSARLIKPRNLSDFFPTLPGDAQFFVEFAKAYGAKSPRDLVNEELARNWLSEGYNKMSLNQYTQAINAKTGAKLKPGAMGKRRYAKLGLMTKRPPGPTPKA